MSEQERGPGWVAAARASAVLLVAGSLLAGCASGSSQRGHELRHRHSAGGGCRTSRAASQRGASCSCRG